MSAKKEIFELIDALTPNEKAYISKFLLKNNNKDSEYLKLYNYICKVKDVDIQDIKKEFKDTNISKNLAAAFHYLYEQILDTLAPLVEKNPIDIPSWQQINHIQFLNHKALYTRSAKKITALKRLLEKYEMNELLLIIIQIEIELISYLKKSLDEKLQLIQRKIEINQQISNESMAQLQLHTSEKLVFNYGVSTRNVEITSIQKIKTILNDLLKQKTISLKTKHYIYHAFSNLAIADNKYEEALNNLGLLIREYEKSPHFKIHYIGIYVKLLCNYINRLVSAGAFEKIKELDTILQEIKKISSNKKVEKTMLEDVYITYYHAKYTYHLSLENFDEAYDMTERMREYKLPMEKNKALFIIYHYDFACASFYVQKYDLALHYSNLLLSHENRNVFPDVQIFARILQLFVWYEKDEQTMVQTQYEAMRKHLQTVSYDATVEKAYLKMILKLSHTIEKNKKLDILQESESTMQSLKNIYPSAFMFFKIFWWLRKETFRLKQ